MDLYVLGTEFQTLCVLDLYVSLVWVDKFNEPGTFELEVPFSKKMLEYIQPDNYLMCSNSEHLMIIEDISYETNVEDGNKIKAVGRSLESILERRIIWAATKFNNVNLQTSIQTLLNDAFVSPTVLDRKVDIFDAFVPSVDPRISSLILNRQYIVGDNLLEIIHAICADYGLGFKITLNENDHFVFSLYVGDNRSYSQTENPYVVFSPDYDNIIDSIYTNQKSQSKNIALVKGTATKIVGVNSGISRRELFVDANDIDKGSLSNSKYNALLEKRGVEKLDEANRGISFDANCDTHRMYVYGRDFFLGDIVQIGDSFGVEAAAKITEFTWSYTTSGVETYPTFDPLEETVYSGKNKIMTTLENLKALNTAGEWTDNVWCNNNVVVTVNQDSEGRVVGITFNGKNSSSSNIVFQLGVISLSEGDAANNLVLSGCRGGSSSTYKISQYDQTSNAERAINYDGDTLITVLDRTHTYRVRLTFFRNKDFIDVTIYPMVRSVSENNSFEPYIGE